MGKGKYIDEVNIPQSDVEEGFKYSLEHRRYSLSWCGRDRGADRSVERLKDYNANDTGRREAGSMANTSTSDVIRFAQRFRPILKSITDRIPPDYSLLEQALRDGLDINVYDSNAEDAISQETLLSTVLDNYAYDLDAEDYPYLPDIVRWFLEHGYDVHGNNECHGILDSRDTALGYHYGKCREAA